MINKTELEWTCQPEDYFEGSTSFSFAEGNLSIDAGSVKYALSTPCDPVPPALQTIAAKQVAAVFAARRLLTRRPYSVSGPHISQQNAGGGRSVTVTAGVAVARSVANAADLIITNLTGKVVTDTKAERIANDNSFISALAPKMLSSPTLRLMLESWGRAVDDPANELVHLYEVRDSACKHYGNESTARAALGIAKPEWQILGRLCNDEPLLEGRHRGRQIAGLRHATPHELSEARRIALLIVNSFADTI